LCYALNHDGKEIEGSVGTSRARWPEAAQAELAELVLEIDAELGAGAYKATKAELDGIDRGLKAAGEGRFATSDQVDDLFRKYRPT
jgi:predicted transcriptional regulator